MSGVKESVDNTSNQFMEFKNKIDDNAESLSRLNTCISTHFSENFDEVTNIRSELEEIKTMRITRSIGQMEEEQIIKQKLDTMENFIKIQAVP